MHSWHGIHRPPSTMRGLRRCAYPASAVPTSSIQRAACNPQNAMIHAPYLYAFRPSLCARILSEPAPILRERASPGASRCRRVSPGADVVAAHSAQRRTWSSARVSIKPAKLVSRRGSRLLSAPPVPFGLPVRTSASSPRACGLDTPASSESAASSLSGAGHTPPSHVGDSAPSDLVSPFASGALTFFFLRSSSFRFCASGPEALGGEDYAG